MITPKQMLQEAIEEINSLSVDELEAMFREAGFDPVKKEPQNYSSLPNQTAETEWLTPVAPTLSLNRNFMMSDEFLDTAA